MRKGAPLKSLFSFSNMKKIHKHIIYTFLSPTKHIHAPKKGEFMPNSRPPPYLLFSLHLEGVFRTAPVRCIGLEQCGTSDWSSPISPLWKAV